MKVNKSMLLVLGVSVVVIVIIFLVFTYRSQASERDSLSRQISAENQTAANLDVQKLSLQTKKSQLNDQMTRDTTAFQQAGSVYLLPLESIDYGKQLFQLALGNNLQIGTLTMSSPSTEKKDNLSYRVMNINLDLTGTLKDITHFIETLTGNFAGISISNLSITQMNSAAAQPRLNISLRANQITGE